METNCSLQLLGESYRSEASNLDELMERCQQRRHSAMRYGHSAEALRQEKLLEMHRQQRNELRQLSVWLCHYYDGTQEKTGRGGAKGGIKQ